MRHKDETKFKVIAEEIKRYLIKHGRMPTQREISQMIGLGQTATCSYIKTMREKGLIEGAGRYIQTEGTKLIAIPIVNSLADNKHIYDEAIPEDYIFISRKPFGDGEFGIVRAIDNSMLIADIKVDNLIIIKRQKTAEFGQIVLARTSTGKYILRRYIFDERSQKPMLQAESPNNEYELITEFEIRGKAVSAIARIDG